MHILYSNTPTVVMIQGKRGWPGSVLVCVKMSLQKRQRTCKTKQLRQEQETKSADQK